MMHKVIALGALSTATEGVVHSKNAEVAAVKTFMSAEDASEAKSGDETAAKDKSQTSSTTGKGLVTPTGDQKTQAQQAADKSIPPSLFSAKDKIDQISVANILAATSTEDKKEGAATIWLNKYSTVTTPKDAKATTTANDSAIAAQVNTLADADNVVTGLTFQAEEANLNALVTKVCTGKNALNAKSDNADEKKAFTAVCADDDANSVKSRLAVISTSEQAALAKLNDDQPPCPDCGNRVTADYIKNTAGKVNGKFQKQNVLDYVNNTLTWWFHHVNSNSSELDKMRKMDDKEPAKKAFLDTVHALRDWFKAVKADSVYTGEVQTAVDKAETAFKPIDEAKSALRSPFTAIAAAIALFMLV